MKESSNMNKYLAIIAVVLSVMLYYAFGRINTLENKNHALQAEKTALEREVRNYNEKSMEASKEIRELKLKAEQGKKTNPNAYHCFDGTIPLELLN